MAEIKAAQRVDPDIVQMCEYKERDILPIDEKLAKRLVLESERYKIIQGVLYFEPLTHLGNCVL